ncbi:MAG: AAA family ATPase [Clostridia bacterium]|nr:AAA family ATPase [Clostridia bacterium]
MYITELNIKSFGPLTDKNVSLEKGLNIVEGANESGKSTLAMFIKFALYGLSDKPYGKSALSEKDRFIDQRGDFAAGSLKIRNDGKTYTVSRRIDRIFDGGKTIYKESSSIVNESTGETVDTRLSAGEYFTKLPEKVFYETALVEGLDAAGVNGAELKTALDNIMTSGDEQLNAKRALEALDSASRALKGGATGGKIGELEAERDRLGEMLTSSKGASEKTVEIESAIADVSAKRSKREKEAAELGRLCEAYENIRISSRVKKIEVCEDALKSAREELSSIDPNATEETLRQIEECENSVIDTERELDALAERKASLKEKCEGRDTEEPRSAEQVVSDSKKIKRASTFCLSSGCTFGVLALAALAALLIPSVRSKIDAAGYMGLMIIVTTLFAVLCGVAIIMFLHYSKKFEEFLGVWDSEDEDDLESAVAAKHDSYKYTGKLIESLKKTEEDEEAAITKHDREIDRGMEIGDMLGIERSDNVFEVLALAKETVREECRRREETEERIRLAEEELSELLSGEEGVAALKFKESGRITGSATERILSMTKEDYAKLKRSKEFAASAAASLKKRGETLEAELATLGSAGRAPSETAGRIDVIEEKIARLTEKYEAINAARRALASSCEKMRVNVTPRVASRAAEYMSRLTNGKYASLSSGDDFALSVSSGEGIDFDHLSEGTKDAAYIALRLALTTSLCDVSSPVIVFDECFSRLDDARLSSVLSLLLSDGMPQSIVTSCRAISPLAEGANTIKL